MGTVFLWLFMAWLFKGFGKAMTHSGGKDVDKPFSAIVCQRILG